ncbi:hypothetical protein ACOSQ4_025253 [Xanthoceras sorbifolium]
MGNSLVEEVEGTDRADSHMGNSLVEEVELQSMALGIEDKSCLWGIVDIRPREVDYAEPQDAMWHACISAFGDRIIINNVGTIVKKATIETPLINRILKNKEFAEAINSRTPLG